MCENENIQSSYRYYNMGKFSSVSIVIFKVDLALPFEEKWKIFLFFFPHFHLGKTLLA